MSAESVRYALIPPDEHQSAGFRFRRSWVQIPQGGPKIRKFQLSDFLFSSQIYHHIKGEKKNADRRNNSNRTPDAPRNDA